MPRGRRRALRLQLRTTDSDVVLRFRDAVGCGKVYGPYSQRDRKLDGELRKPFYGWVADAEDALAVLGMFWPWIGERRRERAEELGFSLHVKTAKA